MDWKSIYQSKRMTVNEAIALIHNGDKVVTGFACGERWALNGRWWSSTGTFRMWRSSPCSP